MIVITPEKFEANQEKYLDLAEKQQVAIKNGNKLIHLVVSERILSDKDLKTLYNITRS
ncbi:MAG: hypothetical protein GX963_08825 [Bacteroidales bacterium]|nr:hypothetical protein [Bacteroidales bacterium]